MATIALTLKPFPVPTEVVIEMPGTGVRQNGMKPLPTLKLNQLDVETAEALITEFAEAVMAAVNAK